MWTSDSRSCRTIVHCSKVLLLLAKKNETVQAETHAVRLEIRALMLWWSVKHRRNTG